MSAVVVSELTKKFRRELVFNDFNLEVFDGEIFSVMGLEKSGKTTLARILFNFYKPNRGHATIFDMDTRKESKSIKEFASYVPEDVWIYENLKPMALFKHTLAFHGLKNTDEIQSLMEYFEIDNKHKFIDMTDSERKRVAIVNALITKPKLIVIDEPTKYLSHALVEKLFTHLKRLQSSEGLTVLLLTDDLAIGQRFADRGAYLSGGRLVGIEYLKDKKNNDKVLSIFDELVSIAAFQEIGADLLKDDSGDIQFFYDGYLPNLTTVLHQQKVKNYSLEDALLKDKIDSFSGESYSGPRRETEVHESSEDTFSAEETILAYDADRLQDEPPVDEADIQPDPFDEANRIDQDHEGGRLFDTESDASSLDSELAEETDEAKIEPYDGARTEATMQFVVHQAEERDDATMRMDQPLEAADGYDAEPTCESNSSKANDDGVEPEMIDAEDAFQEDKYSFNPGKEEDE